MNAYKQAIVIGGSIAGLTAAEVLSRKFEHVTVIERDQYPEGTEFRKGIPQMRQPHMLLKRGLLGLESLFPGFTEDWADAGAVSANMGQDCDWFVFGQWRPRYDPPLVSYGSTRPVLENTIRMRVKTNSKISFLEAMDVVGLLATNNNGAISGVRVRSRDGRGTEDVIEAELVVDASGRESHTAEWLESLGYPCPERTVVNAFPGYSSRIYEWPEDMTSKLVYIQPDAPHLKRGAIILPLEGKRVHVALIGMAKDYPPTDEEGFINFLAGLPEKRAYDLLVKAKPLSPISGYRRADNVWHHYEKLPRWPENFAVVGDAAMAFNPVYGQGMTLAIMSALTLGESLEKHLASNDTLTGFVNIYRKAVAKVQSFAWQLAAGEDMRWSPATEGCSATPGLIEGFRLNFLKKVMVASTKDPAVTEALYRVMNMVASPSVFFRPAMMTRIMRAS